LVIAPVRPAAVGDTYPTAYANELLGGHKQANLLTDRAAIPASLRQEGMTCWVIETGTLYVLSGGIADANWSALAAVQPVVTPGGAYALVTQSGKLVFSESGDPFWIQ
jgi:hypothetical protein